MSLTSNHCWFAGPPFLMTPADAWPTTGTVSEPLAEDPEVASSR